MKLRIFFIRWFKGIKSFADSHEGELQSKLFFYFFVLIGLFGAGFQYLNSENYFMVMVMWGFFGIVFFDFIRLFRAYKFSKYDKKFLGDKRV